MIELRVLGTRDLRDASRERALGAILAQPKRVAFLTFLALEGRNGLLARDLLVGTFWSQSPEDRARNSLSQMLSALRRVLGAEAIVTRGDEVMLDAEAVWCDASAFEDLLDDGDRGAALEVYGGDLLPGLHLSDTVEFEHWLDRTRQRLRGRATGAALEIAAAEAETNPVEAVRQLRRATVWDPFDERVVQRLVPLLDALGDGAGALREYEAFRARMAEDLDLDPAPETRALIDAIRSLQEVAERPAEPSAAVAGGAREAPVRPRGRRLAPRGLLTVTIVAAAAVIAWLIAAPGETGLPPLAGDRVLVAPLENRAGDSSLDPLGLAAADRITQALARSGLARVVSTSTLLREIRSPSSGPGSANPGRSWLEVAREVGAGILVTGAFYARRDSIVVQAQIVDATTGLVRRAIAEVASARSDPTSGIDRLRERTLGALATLLDERLDSWPDPGDQPPSLESYHLLSEAFDLFLRANQRRRLGRANVQSVRLYREAAARFVAAAGSDSSFVTPLLWAGFAFANAGDAESALTLLRAL